MVYLCAVFKMRVLVVAVYLAKILRLRFLVLLQSVDFLPNQVVRRGANTVYD